MSPVLTPVRQLNPDITRECELAKTLIYRPLTAEEWAELQSLWIKNNQQAEADRLHDNFTESRAWPEDRTNFHD